MILGYTCMSLDKIGLGIVIGQRLVVEPGGESVLRTKMGVGRIWVVRMWGKEGERGVELVG